MKYKNGELCLIWLDSFVGLEYKHKQELYKLIEGKAEIKYLLEKGKDYIINAIGENEYSTLLSSANASYLDYILTGLERRNVVAVTAVSDGYPESLLNTPCPPLVLYCKGNISLLKGNNFAIVGSRKSLPLSIKLAENYAKALVNAGFVLVTGIAEGVDSTVLDAVLSNGGKAISVLGGGFDNVYPKSNEQLLDCVIKNGLAVCEYPPEVVPRSFHYPVRNRIIAALSRGVLIVSGGIKSGTKYTAEYAEEYGKDLFAVPYNSGVTSGAGCNDLIKRGAMLTDTPDDVLEFYGIEEEKPKHLILSDVEKDIVNALKDGESHVEKLCKAVKKRVFEIMPVLSSLEIKGVVHRIGVNVYGLIRKELED